MYVRDEIGNLQINDSVAYRRNVDGRFHCFFAGADQVINPGTASDVLRASLGNTWTGLIENAAGMFTVNGVRPIGKLAELSFKLGCENTPMKTGILTVMAEDLASHKL